VLRCIRCGLYYKSATPTAERLKEYYQRINCTSWDTDGLFPTERRLLVELTDLPPGSSFLDFGCGSGRILSGLTGRYHCFGFEINPESAAVAVTRGLTMLTESELYDAARDSFDAILLIDVFEHLPAPLRLLERLVGQLRIGGRLAIITGNADAPACRKDPANFWYFRLYGHLLMLSRAHGRYIANVLGLRLRRWVEMSHYDLPEWKNRIREAARTWAYDMFHRDHPPIARQAMRLLPIIRRAQRWTERPTYPSTADHAVAVYEKVSSPHSARVEQPTE
jgi:SAM-dependent methyltransferase